MLPSWHVYERACEYFAHASGVTIVYSATGRFAADLLAARPHILISVPGIWESVYQKFNKALAEFHPAKRRLIKFFIRLNLGWMRVFLRSRNCHLAFERRSAASRTFERIVAFLTVIALWPGHVLSDFLFQPFREKVGGRLRVATCSAGTLPRYLDESLNALGIELGNAYGMTECAGGILSRRLEGNTIASEGRPLAGIEVVFGQDRKQLAADLGLPLEAVVKGDVLLIENVTITRALLD